MRLRRVLLSIGILLILGIAGAVVFVGVPSLQIATGYAAKQTCSCLFASERALDSCLGDFDQGIAGWLTWDTGENDVSVSLAGLFENRAEFDDGFGCHAVD